MAVIKNPSLNRLKKKYQITNEKEFLTLFPPYILPNAWVSQHEHITYPNRSPISTYINPSPNTHFMGQFGIFMGVTSFLREFYENSGQLLFQTDGLYKGNL